MADVVMVTTMVGFILLCVAYVGWCDRIGRADDAQLVDTLSDDRPGDTTIDGDAAAGSVRR